MLYGIRSLRHVRQIRGADSSENDILELELALIVDPLAGELIPGARGLRKLRQSLAGRGKRSSARVIYYFVTPQDTLLLLHAYEKNRANDLPKPFLRELADAIKSQFP